MLVLNAENRGDVEKAQVLAWGKYLATKFLLRLDRRRYGELILAFKNNYAKQQQIYHKALTDMYGLMVAFDPTRVTLVSGGHNEGLNFGSVAVESKTAGDRDHDIGGGMGRKIECWSSGGNK